MSRTLLRLFTYTYATPLASFFLSHNGNDIVCQI
jgi:hypothetical protein